MIESMEAFISTASRIFAARIEDAVRDLMKREGLTKDDIRTRCTWITWPDGRNQITLDGVPRIEWSPGVSKTNHESTPEEAQ